MTRKIVGFNYAALRPQDRATAQENAAAIKGLVEKTATAVVEIGRRLNEVHDRLGRKFFTPWLKAEFDWSQAVASNYMQAAKRFGDSDCVAQFQSSAIVDLARRMVPAAAIDEAINAAANGQPITRAVARQIISRHHPERGASLVGRESVTRFRSSLKSLAERVDEIIVSLAREELDELIDQLLDVATQLRSARSAKPVAGVDKKIAQPRRIGSAPALTSVQP